MLEDDVVASIAALGVFGNATVVVGVDTEVVADVVVVMIVGAGAVADVDVVARRSGGVSGTKGNGLHSD